MTRDEIGELVAALPEGLEADEVIHRLVNWAVDREREACAKVCDDWQDSFEIDTRGWWASSLCAITIRARGEKAEA